MSRFRPAVARTLVILASIAPAAKAVETALPLEQVVLFTSGVGFYRHGGRVADDARIDMTFKTDQINDLLKSMVLEDLDGGTVAAVSYASRDPVTKTLGTFAVNLTDNPSVGQLLSRLRGARVAIDAATPATGTVVGVEKRVMAMGEKTAVEKEFVTILAKEGLRTLPLESITRLEILDDRLREEFEKALAVLASGTDNDRKSVSLTFSGKGERRIRVGYVQEAPVWKTSYRIVLDEAGGPQALLQGWAIVENTTDQDWKDVRMALVGGRPISFVMDLYQPLYLPRPEVRPQLLASLLPQVYGQDLGAAELQMAKGADKQALEGLARREMARDRAEPRSTVAAAAAPGAAMPAEKAAREGMAQGAGAIRSLAEGADLGAMFRYEIAAPVSIPRQRSAMLPIVTEKVAAEKVSIYDERVLAKHPLAGLRLVNSTKLDLMQGPVTVYDHESYAGDARIEDLPAGGERLVSYAVDLDIEVAPRAEPRPEEIVAVKLAKGTLVVTRKLARRKVFDIKGSVRAPVKLLVEHPREPGWRLVQPEHPAETSRDRYRFAVTVEPDKTATLEVAEEQPTQQHLAIVNTDDPTLLAFTNAKRTSRAVREALADIVTRKRAIESLVQERTQREQEVAAVSQEQERIRQNMGQLDRTSELYTRYVKKFASQEDRVETLRREIADFQRQEQEARRVLDDVLGKLELE